MNQRQSQLRRLREQARLSQEKLAQHCGLSSRTISLIERGHGMRASTALKIAEALGCSLEDLLREEET
jgi:transcriptional regulator with XRE-family HTH domain